MPEITARRVVMLESSASTSGRRVSALNAASRSASGFPLSARQAVRRRAVRRLRLEGFKRRVVQSQKRVHVGWNGGGGLFSHHRRVRQGRQAG